jgi:ABC-2 type transport system permease protein
MMVMLPAMLPYLLASNFMVNPTGPIAILFSFFPLTAAVTLLFRLAFSTVPTWQIIASTGTLLLSTVAAFWFAGRVFRIWMLRYRKPVNWKEKLRTVFKTHPRRETARDE